MRRKKDTATDADDDDIRDKYRGLQPPELLKARDNIDAEIRLIHNDANGNLRDLSEADQRDFDQLILERKEVQRQLDWHQDVDRQFRQHPGAALTYNGESIFGGRTVTRDLPEDPIRRQWADRGLRALDAHSELLDKAGGERLEQVIRQADPQGLASRYLDAVSSPHYFSAFGKWCMDPMTGHLRMSAEEVEAVRVVSQVQAERAVGVKSGGGELALPFTLDSTIILSGAGAINPIRELARVFATETDVWKGVSADTPTAAYGAEGSEVGDQSPTLVQPTITCRRGSAFVPYSIEASQDWADLAAELTRLLDDARAVLDATKFLLGNPSSEEPAGILNIGGTGSLTTSQRIQTTTTGTYGLPDVYLLKQALPARFMPNATWCMHPTTGDVTYRFVPEGSTSEPKIFDAGRSGPLLGKSLREWSSMATGATTGTKIALYADFRAGFYIADRIGSSVEIVPHLFGATNHRPVGMRGLFYYWRSGSVCAVPNAFRYLEAK